MARLAVNKNGVQYLAYTDGAQSNKATVMQYNSGEWSALGGAGFSAAAATTISPATDPSSGAPYVAFIDASQASKVTVMKFSSGSWVGVGSAGFSAHAAIVNSVSMAFDPNTDTPYVAFADSVTNHLVVMSYDSGTWSVVGSSGLSSCAYGGGPHSIAIDPLSSSVYVAGLGNVCKYSGGNWSVIGSNFSAQLGGVYSREVSIVLNPQTGVPYIAFIGSDNLTPHILQFTSGSWQNLGAQVFNSSMVFDNLAFAIDPISATPQIAFADSANGNRTTVMKYSAGNWVPVGTADFSFGQASNVSLDIDPTNGAPITSYFDKSANGAGIAMIYYTGSSASALGWTTNSPSSSAQVQAAWIKSADPTLSDQKIQLYADENCGTPSGPVIDLDSASTQVVNLTAFTGSLFSYRVQSIFSTRDPIWSPCSGEMGVRSVWSYVGGLDSFITQPAGTVSQFAQAIDASNGDLYFASSNQSGISVKKYSSGAWSSLPSASGVSPNSLSLVVDPTTHAVFLAFDYDYLANNLPSLFVEKYSGGSWVSIMDPNNAVAEPEPCQYPTSQTACSSPQLAIDSSGALYLAYLGGGPNSADVLAYSGGVWNSLGLLDGDIQTVVGPFGFTVDPNSGTPYVVCSINGQGGQSAVESYSASTGNWTSVGGSDFFTVLDAHGLDSWNAASITVDPITGNPYVFYVDFSNNAGSVLTFSGGNWSLVGNADFTGQIQNIGTYPYAAPPIAVNPINGIPYIAYNNFSATTDSPYVAPTQVMAYINGTWTVIGPANLSRGNSFGTSLGFVPATGTLYTGYLDLFFGVAAVRRWDP